MKPVFKKIKGNTDTWKDKNVLVYAGYCPSTTLSPLHTKTVETYVRWGYTVVSCYNTNDVSTSIKDNTNAECVFMRENLGYDFGIYKDICTEYEEELKSARSVTFLNESVAPILENRAFQTHVENTNLDVVFPVSSLERQPHAQSWFVCVKKSGLKKNALDVFKEFPYEENQEVIINEMELPLHAHFKRRGITVDVIWKKMPLKASVTLEHGSQSVVSNPTTILWAAFLEEGAPFLKLKAVSLGLVNKPLYLRRNADGREMVHTRHNPYINLVPSEWRDTITEHLNYG